MITLQELGFIDTSHTDEENNFFQEFTLEKDNFVITIYGVFSVEILLNECWSEVPNCKTINDLEYLIKLFSK